MQAAISVPHSRMKQPMSLHIPMLPTAQLTTWSRKKRESVQVCATQPARHESENVGMPPPPPNEKQPNTQVRLCPHEFSEHMPQSRGQLMQSSKPPADSHRMLPQTEQTPQSRAQLAQSSVPRQRPSPQPVQMPQSAGQLKQVSPAPAVQVPSPQVSHAPQSGAQLKQSSPEAGVQKPSPQRSQRPQSAGQLLQLSVA